MNYRTKKRFGQHFLNDQQVIERILEHAAIGAHERVVEIGPGLGVLTEPLLQQALHLDVFEIDRDLIARLEAREETHLQVHAGDILRADLCHELLDPPYVVVANLPYNISTPIVFLLLEQRQLFSRMVLMFQKEVGLRLCAAPASRDYGVLSVLTQLWFDLSPVVEVGPWAFTPPPKVDSLVVELLPRQSPKVDPVDPVLFPRVVRAAFTQRRKQLRNSLIAGGFPAGRVDDALSLANISPRLRGEALSLEDFSRLTAAFYRLQSDRMEQNRP